MSDKFRSYSFRLIYDGIIEKAAIDVLDMMVPERGGRTQYCDDEQKQVYIREVVAMALMVFGLAARRYTSRIDDFSENSSPVSINSIARWAESAIKQYETPQDEAITLEDMAEQLNEQFDAVKRMIAELRSAGIQVSIDRKTPNKKSGVAASMLANIAKNYASHNED